MKEQYKDLGKVCLTVEGYWSIDKEYEKITIVNDAVENSYISKKDVPIGIELTNKEYWQQIASKNIKLYKLNVINELTEDSIIQLIKEAFTPLTYNKVIFPTVNDILIDQENNEYASILYTSITGAPDEGGFFICYIYNEYFTNNIILKFINIGGEDYNNNMKVLSVLSYDISDINKFIDISKDVTFVAGTDGIDSTVWVNNNKVYFKLPWITGQKIINNDPSKDAEFIIPLATKTSAGVISKEDKSKVDTIGTSEDSPNPNGTVFARIKDLKNNAVGKKTIEGGEIFNDYGNNHAVGNLSHAEGNSTIANGDHSHAEGHITYTYGVCSHTEGDHTIANNYAEHASGQWNKSTTSGTDSATTWKGDNIATLFSIGNGTGVGTDRRKNAFEVKQDGTILIQKPTTSEVINLQDYLLNRFILRSQKGIAGGVATLDSTGKIPSNQLPAGIDDVKDIIYGSNSLSTLISSSNWTSAKIGDRGLVYKSSKGTEDGIYVKTNSGYTKEEFQKDLIYVIDTGFTCGNVTFNTNTCWRWSGTQLAQTNSGIVIGNVEGTAFDGGKGTNIENDINKLKDTIDTYGNILTPAYTQNSTESTLELEFKTINNNFEINPLKAVIAFNSATNKKAGLMSAADKIKLSRLEENKQDKLKSGENIATINNKDITKGGNIYTYVEYNLSFIDELSTSSSVSEVEQAFSPSGVLIKPSVGDIFKGSISDKNIVNGIVTNVYFLPTEANKITIEYRKKNIFVTLKIDFNTYKVLAKSEWNAEKIIGNSTDDANPNGTIFARLKSKQDTLESGVNIATINGNDITKGNNIVINPTIIDLKWTTNVATTRKLVPEELRAKDVRIAYTNRSSVYIVEKYKVEAIDDINWTNNDNWIGCRTPLTPLFENAGARFNDDIGYYEMNGLTDLTENDLFIAWSYPRLATDFTINCSFSCFSSDKKRQIRTNFPFVTFFRSANELTLYGQTNLEIFSTANLVSRNTQPFSISKFNTWSCFKLRKFLGIIDVNSALSKISTYDNNDLILLEELYLQHVKVDVSIFKNSPYIIYDCIKYLINNASNTKAITVTVHQTTYGYLTGTIEPTEQVGGTTEKWQQIVTDAQAKQISFATI